jgi:hypothetical protein
MIDNHHRCSQCNSTTTAKKPNGNERWYYSNGKKICANCYNHNYYLEHKTELSQYYRQRYLDNTESMKEYRHNYYLRNRKVIKKQSNEYYYHHNKTK